MADQAKQTKQIHLDWEVSPQQAEFLRDEVHRHLGYGGARGGGKSWGLRAKAIKMCLKYKGYRYLIMRRTYPELLENHIKPLLEILQGIAKYNDGRKEFRFCNGSIIKLGYCDSDRAVLRYQGQEWDSIGFDEATQLKEEWIVRIRATNRGTNDYPRQCVYTMNPGGVSHGFFKRLFHDKVYRQGEKPEEFHFIAARVTDNKALLDQDPAYLESLMALPPKLREAWLYGSWDILEGQFFSMWRNDPEGYKTRKWTHVIPAEGFRVPQGWPIYRSFDWGSYRPFSCGWWTVDYDGILYRIAELYGCKKDGGESVANLGVKWTPDIVFSKIAQMEREHPLLRGRKITYGVADPAIWDSQYGPSLADMAAREGVHFIKGDHARIPGWQQCMWLMQFDDEGIPRMYVLDSCKDFIRTIPTLVHDEHNPEDLDSNGEDHAADEFRYLAMSSHIKPKLEEKPYRPQMGIDPLEQFDARRRY